MGLELHPQADPDATRAFHGALEAESLNDARGEATQPTGGWREAALLEAVERWPAATR